MIFTANSNYLNALLPSMLMAIVGVGILPLLNRHNNLVRMCVLGVCIALSWRYLLWRIAFTIPDIGHPVDFVVGVIFTTVEFLSVIGTTLTEIFLSRTLNRGGEADRNIEWFKALKNKPKIDVLICTYNEDLDILEATILGALAMNYSNFRVWVCDDGSREELKRLCDDVGAHYLTRSDNQHAKAGNINAALKSLGALSDRPDFVAILDADFIPMADFLSRAVLLTRDDDVGIVQTPQHFFNSDPVQSNLALTRVWPDEQRFFFDTVMASKDAWGVAFCCGTSSLIRFDVLESINGFPTDSVTEDYLLTLRFRERGFRTVYLNEVLSLGLAPEGLKEYYGQRSRWCLGAVQICRGRSGPLNFSNGLPLIDRISLVDTFLFWSASHAMRLLAFIVPALFLLFDIKAVSADVKDAISYVLPFILAQLGILLWLTEGRILPIMSDLYGTLCATEVIKAVAVGLLRPKGQKFKVTAKGGDRSSRIIQWPVLRTFLFYLLLNILGIANAFVFHQSNGLTDMSLLALIWSWYNIIILLLASYVCIEQPQRRYKHRFPMTEPVRIKCDNRISTYQTRDISVSGIRLAGALPQAIGSIVAIEVGPYIMRARMVRKTIDGFALTFEPTLTNRAHVIQFIFSKRYAMQRSRIEPKRVILALGARLFR